MANVIDLGIIGIPNYTLDLDTETVSKVSGWKAGKLAISKNQQGKKVVGMIINGNRTVRLLDKLIEEAKQAHRSMAVVQFPEEKPSVEPKLEPVVAPAVIDPTLLSKTVVFFKYLVMLTMQEVDSAELPESLQELYRKVTALYNAYLNKIPIHFADAVARQNLLDALCIRRGGVTDKDIVLRGMNDLIRAQPGVVTTLQGLLATQLNTKDPCRSNVAFVSKAWAYINSLGAHREATQVRDAVSEKKKAFVVEEDFAAIDVCNLVLAMVPLVRVMERCPKLPELVGTVYATTVTSICTDPFEELLALRNRDVMRFKTVITSITGDVTFYAKRAKELYPHLFPTTPTNATEASALLSAVASPEVKPAPVAVVTPVAAPAAGSGSLTKVWREQSAKLSEAIYALIAAEEADRASGLDTKDWSSNLNKMEELMVAMSMAHRNR